VWWYVHEGDLPERHGARTSPSPPREDPGRRRDPPGVGRSDGLRRFPQILERVVNLWQGPPLGAPCTRLVGLGAWRSGSRHAPHGAGGDHALPGTTRRRHAATPPTTTPFPACSGGSTHGTSMQGFSTTWNHCGTRGAGVDDDTLRVTVDGSNPHLPPVMIARPEDQIGRGQDRRAESMLRRVDLSSGLGVQQ
jgi:hypothetical protein